ncbi:MAG: class I SAM-dependent methyltransferase, partial [Minisyncoccia bacterium]
ENVYKLKKGEAILDLGCGTGDILNYIPEGIKYYGIDIRENYISEAEKKFRNKGVFFVEDAIKILKDKTKIIDKVDLIIANGFLHHLDNEEAKDLLNNIRNYLKEGGRCIFLEPVYLFHQKKFSKWIMGLDRGQHIRSESEWKTLISSVFDSFQTHILQGLIFLPYIHILIECKNDLFDDKRK